MDLEDKVNEQFTDEFNKKELANKIKSEVEELRASNTRVAHEAIWMNNIAYLLGFQNLVYSLNLRQFINNQAPKLIAGRNKLIVNKILPTIQNRLAQLCKNPPRYDVIPESQSTEDRDAARLSLQVLNSLWDKLDINQKRISLNMWVQQCGHAYIKVSWDKTKGQWIKDPETNEAMFEGDVRIEVVSSFEVFVDAQAKTLEEARYLYHCRVRDLQYFKDQYGDAGTKVKEENVWLMSLRNEQRVQSMNVRGQSDGTNEQVKNCAIEIVKYERPSAKYPRGRMIVSANGELLKDEELPTGKIPFVKFDDVVVGGKYYSESIITHLRPLQDQYNETVSRRAEWTKRLLAGKYVAARGSELAQEALNDQSGEVLLYTPVPNAPGGGMPSAMQIPTIPSYAYEEETRLDSSINYISGVSDISRGTLPSASIPALGMQILLEADQTRVGVMIDQHERAWANVGNLILEFVSKFYVIPRKFKFGEKNSQYLIKEIIGDDLKGNTDVIVVKGSSLPNSKALKRQDILNAYNQGLLGDPKDPKVREQVLGMLEFGDVAEMWQDFALDMNQIKRGIEVLKSGQMVEAHELDNHTMWIEELNKLRKSDDYKELDSNAQQAVEICIEQHLGWITKLTTPAQTVPGMEPPEMVAPVPPPAAPPQQ